MSQFNLFEQIISQMTDMLFVMSADDSSHFRYVKMNSSAMHASGLNEYAYGATFQDVVVSDEADILNAQYLRTKQLARPVSFVLNHNGQIGESVLNPIFSPDGKCTHIVGTVRDITDRYQREEQLRQQAEQDALTGLLNRRGLDARLQTLFLQTRELCAVASVFLIDVDKLKQINDRYGHVIGDLYLQEIAGRIRSAIRTEDTISRLGGDEFLVAARVNSHVDTVLLAERILQAFEAPWPHRDVVIRMSVSIGVASYPVHGRTPWDVIQSADAALYRAKSLGGKRYELAP